MRCTSRHWLTNLRKLAGYPSRDWLAEALNVSVRCIEAWERGESTPDRSNRIKLARLLGGEILFRLAHEELEAARVSA